MLLRRATRWSVVSTVALLLPALAGAQGFALNEIGSCAVARSFAVTAGGCSDASLIFWNPAATGRLDGWSTLIGASSITLKGAFIRDTTGVKYESTAPTAIVPTFFVNHHTKGSKLALGAGVYVPYGLTSQWGSDFPGRFEAKKASLQTLYVQPNASWQLNDKWSIGGGPIWAHSSVELQQAIDLSSNVAAAATATTPAITFGQLGIPKGTQFATADIKGSSSGFGGQVGIIGKLNSTWTMGARYLFPITFKYDKADATFHQDSTRLVLAAAVGALPAGTAVDVLVAPSFTAAGPLSTQHASTSIAHPAQAQIGFNYMGMKDWNWEFDYQWTQWSKFRELAVTFDTTSLSRTFIEDYNNSSALRISAARSFANKADLRLGIAGVTTAAPDETVSPLLPEQERAYYTVGGGYPIMGAWTLDGSFAYISTLGRRGRTDPRFSRVGTGAALIDNGVYTLKAYVLSFSLKASF